MARERTVVAGAVSTEAPVADGGRSTARRRGPSSVTGCAKNDLLGGGAVGSAGGRIVIPWDSGATNGGAERAREIAR